MEEIDLKELIKIVNEKKFVIIALVLIFIVIGVGYSYYYVVPKYTAETQIVLTKDDSLANSSSQITSSDVNLNSNLVSTYSVLIKSNDVIRKVISNLGLDISESKLKKNISVSAVDDSEVISIKVTDTDPSVAQKVANEITQVFSAQVADIYNLNNVKVVDKADLPTSPSNINHAKDIVIFACIGLVVALCYILLDNLLDTTVKSSEEVYKMCNVPILATIPHVNFDQNNKRK